MWLQSGLSNVNKQYEGHVFAALSVSLTTVKLFQPNVTIQLQNPYFIYFKQLGTRNVNLLEI